MGSLILRRGPQFSDDLGTGDPQISVVLGIPNSPEIWERGGGGGGSLILRDNGINPHFCRPGCQTWMMLGAFIIAVYDKLSLTQVELSEAACTRERYSLVPRPLSPQLRMDYITATR